MSAYWCCGLQPEERCAGCHKLGELVSPAPPELPPAPRQSPDFDLAPRVFSWGFQTVMAGITAWVAISGGGLPTVLGCLGGSGLVAAASWLLAQDRRRVERLWREGEVTHAQVTRVVKGHERVLSDCLHFRFWVAGRAYESQCWGDRAGYESVEPGSVFILLYDPERPAECTPYDLPGWRLRR